MMPKQIPTRDLRLISGDEALKRGHVFPVQRRSWGSPVAMLLYAWALIVLTLIAFAAGAAFGRGVADAAVSVEIGPEGRE